MIDAVPASIVSEKLKGSEMFGADGLEGEYFVVDKVCEEGVLYSLENELVPGHLIVLFIKFL